ncbi:acyl-CoA thioesterase YciA [Rhodoblastus acidophilus]|uniref:Acyl-CoA thioesterase YciA n=1 Tax=Rhodoblastus acidophilus TaxID=1074 RepID=A0A212R7S3_RHOAC|nr:acyl-CoA thioesterase [Rhodoblastus acidophilus]MCW2317281.1 acyl-CoA thioesterase YciA [Rhodoblastus acidophilus]PPQ37961.1 acyl-CoA thioesterase [Rhodoblastus acidophilus]RAI24070.1 acyl-CoA thioesterase [Rhodoblastus acidophilus]SNB68241.1 acyl-CoA thioesterase YciA [Rhodoblastus acidophilus]
MESTTQDAPHGDLTVKIIAMPADTNANGDIFGGWVLSQMDAAGGICGVDRAGGRVVTIKVDTMTFIRPVKVGDVLNVYTAVESIGRTSMKIHIEAWVNRFITNKLEKVTDATFTFVAIDDAGRPRPIPRESGAILPAPPISV